MKNGSDNTYAEQFTDFMRSLADDDTAASTQRAYLFTLCDFARWFLTTNGEELSPLNVTPTDVREYRSYLQRGHKPSSVNRSLAAIRRWHAWSRVKGLTSTELTIKSIRRTPLAPDAPSRVAVNALTRAAEKSSLRDAAIVWLLRGTGARVSEVAGAMVNDITLSPRSGQWQIAGKGHRERVVPLNASVRTAIKRWLDVRPNVQHNRLFVGRDNKPLGTRGIHDLIARLSGGNLHPHALRHYAGTEMARSNPLSVVMRILGHSRLDTVAIYVAVTSADTARAVEALGED
jgi:integrase/recombinase XerC